MRLSTSIVLLTIVLSLIGCGGSVESQLVGTWKGSDGDVEVTLEMKKDGKMVAKGGPMQFNMNYKVEKVEGNTAHVLITPDGIKDEEPETLQMKVEGKTLTVEGAGLFAGTYTKS